MVKKPLSQEASTKKPLLDHSKPVASWYWPLDTYKYLLTREKMSGGFFFIIHWLLAHEHSSSRAAR